MIVNSYLSSEVFSQNFIQINYIIKLKVRGTNRLMALICHDWQDDGNEEHLGAGCIEGLWCSYLIYRFIVIVIIS
jgi:hypothetical protein